MKHEGAELRVLADDEPLFARRLVWYALVRARKPKLVVETGVDKGLGAVLLCSALKKNVEEGHQGYYVGTDINPEAGYLLDGVYANFGRVIYIDSIETLKAATFRRSKSLSTIVTTVQTTKSVSTVSLNLSWPQMRLSLVTMPMSLRNSLSSLKKTDRKFIFVPEMVEGHWYPGAGVGIAFGK